MIQVCGRVLVYAAALAKVKVSFRPPGQGVANRHLTCHDRLLGAGVICRLDSLPGSKLNGVGILVLLPQSINRAGDELTELPLVTTVLFHYDRSFEFCCSALSKIVLLRRTHVFVRASCLQEEVHPLHHLLLLAKLSPKSVVE